MSKLNQRKKRCQAIEGCKKLATREYINGKLYCSKHLITNPEDKSELILMDGN